MANLLDIAMAAPRNATNFETCVDALAAQLLAMQDAAQVRVFIAHAGAAPRERLPQATWIACETRATLPELWGHAVNAGCGDVIALLDADCAVETDWLSHARACAAQPLDLAGGAVEPHGLRTRAAWAAYFADYGAFLLPLPAGTPRELAGNNVLLRRALLAHPQARAWARPQFWKAHLVHALRAAGTQAVSAPALVVRYEKQYGAREWWRKRLRHARCYGAMRASQLAPAKRATLMLLAPFTAPLLLARVWRNVWPRRRYRRELLLSLPWLMVGMSAWAYGEWLGVLFGADRSCEEIV